jgi:hypothetical protein
VTGGEGRRWAAALPTQHPQSGHVPPASCTAWQNVSLAPGARTHRGWPPGPTAHGPASARYTWRSAVACATTPRLVRRRRLPDGYRDVGLGREQVYALLAGQASHVPDDDLSVRRQDAAQRIVAVHGLNRAMSTRAATVRAGSTPGSEADGGSVATAPASGPPRRGSFATLAKSAAGTRPGRDQRRSRPRRSETPRPSARPAVARRAWRGRPGRPVPPGGRCPVRTPKAP